MNPSPHVICIAAFGRGYGKTTLIQGVTKILTSKGMRVSVIKHSAHALEKDPGKDTSRFMESGAFASAILAKDGECAIYLLNQSLTGLISLLSSLGVDLILCEGFKSSPYPKLVIVNSPGELKMVGALKGVIGVISECLDQGQELKVPILGKDPSTVADFILSQTKGGSKS
jgi:molybdopterin-guanine dinucleotide biosynthesis protein B